MEIIKDHDIIIIGGGAAGLRAAIAAADTNPKAKIAIISKVYPTRSHTVSAEGGISAVLKNNDSLEQHAYDTIKGSDFLADQDAVEYFVQKAKEEVIQLEHWGCPWSREKEGKLAVRAFGGMSVKRTVYAADKTGFHMLHTLFERSLQYENIIRYDEWYVTKLLSDENRAKGLIAINLKEGEQKAFSAKAIILSTGGMGRVYESTTNSAIKTGDGMALAFNEGAALKDMEFIQFHPTALPRTGILITEATRGEGGYVLNKEGKRFLKDYLPEKAELGPRDLVARAIINEINEGKGFEGEYGSYVHLDIRHLGEKTIEEKLPQVREISIAYMGIDPVKDPIPVRPAQHYSMGGIHTNINGETTVEGLFATGETACISINGANRLGSNSLSACLVFGAQTGHNAAKIIEQIKEPALNDHIINDVEKNTKSILTKEGNETTAQLTSEMRKIMDKHAGIIRNQKSLEKGIDKILSLKERSKKISIQDKTLVFNTELINYFELKAMLEISETILRTAARRRETRGSHFRTDYPKRDDKNYLVHQLVLKSGDRTIIRETPVVITKWQPEQRKY